VFHTLFGSTLSEYDQYPVIFNFSVTISTSKAVGLGANSSAIRIYVYQLPNVVTPCTFDKQQKLVLTLTQNAMKICKQKKILVHYELSSKFVINPAYIHSSVQASNILVSVSFFKVVQIRYSMFFLTCPLASRLTLLRLTYNMICDIYLHYLQYSRAHSWS
jgi:hypothetical protein